MGVNAGSLRSSSEQETCVFSRSESVIFSSAVLCLDLTLCGRPLNLDPNRLGGSPNSHERLGLMVRHLSLIIYSTWDLIQSGLHWDLSLIRLPTQSSHRWLFVTLTIKTPGLLLNGRSTRISRIIRVESTPRLFPSTVLLESL